jgi:hypothetical protein
VSQKQSVVDGMRMIALKLEFGVFRNQVFERYLSVFPLKHAEELCHVCHCIRKDEILRYIEL